MTAKPAPHQRLPKICLLIRNSLLFVIATKLLAPLAEAADANTIIGSSWVATEYYNGTALVPPLPGSEITLDFEEGKISGSGGCNSYSGTGTYSDHSFRFDAGISWTEMACFPWDLNEQEVAYFGNLHTSVEYAISDGPVLELREGDSQSVIAHFAPIGSAQTHSLSTELPTGSAPTESISVEWVTSDTLVGSSWVAIEYYDGNELVSPILGSAITLAFEEGKISGSGGCNSYSGTVTYSNSSFLLDDGIQWTEMACQPWDLNEQEDSYFGNFPTSVEYAILSGPLLELRDGDSKSVIARYLLLSSAQTHSLSTTLPAVDTPPTESTSVESVTSDTIVGSSWVAIEYYDGTALVPPLPGSEITLTFEEGEISGSGGCNSFFGTGTYSENSFRFDAGVPSTEEACQPRDLNEQEVAYFGNFHTSVEYAILDDVLELRDGDSKSVIAHFVPIGSAQTHSLSTELPAGSAPTESILVESITSNTIIGSSWVAIEYYNGTALVPPLPGSSITLNFEEGRLSGDGGCNSYFGTVTYSNSSFLLDDGTLSTKIACYPWELNEQETSYFQNFDAAMKYEVLDDGNVLELREGDTGAVVARFAPHQSVPVELAGANHTSPVTDIEKIDSADPPSTNLETEFESTDSGVNMAADVAMATTMMSFVLLLV